MTASADWGDASLGTSCTARANPGEESIVLKRASPGVELASPASSPGTQTAELAASAASEGLSLGSPLTTVYLLKLSSGISKSAAQLTSGNGDWYL